MKKKGAIVASGYAHHRGTRADRSGGAQCADNQTIRP